MSDTPYTDRRTYSFTDEDGIHCEAIHAEFARKLERERDEARAERDEWIARFRADEQLIKEAMERNEQ